MGKRLVNGAMEYYADTKTAGSEELVIMWENADVTKQVELRQNVEFYSEHYLICKSCDRKRARKNLDNVTMVIFFFQFSIISL